MFFLRDSWARRGPRVPDLARAGALASRGIEEWAEGLARVRRVRLDFQA